MVHTFFPPYRKLLQEDFGIHSFISAFSKKAKAPLNSLVATTEQISKTKDWSEMNHCFGAPEWTLGHLFVRGISHLESTLVFNSLRTCQRAEQKLKAAKMKSVHILGCPWREPPKHQQ